MATLELTTLKEYLEPDEIGAVTAALTDSGAAPLDEDEKAEPVLVDRDLDDDLFTDFVDRLDANDASADIYLPSDFEDVLEVGEHRIGSAHTLLLVLESLREDFDIDDEDGEVEEVDAEGDFEVLEDDDDDMFVDESTAAGADMKEEQLRHIWRQMRLGAQLSIRRGLCMFVRV